MRKVGAAMEEQGLAVEYIQCSGDPDSLDAVIIPSLATAIVDGTRAPRLSNWRTHSAAGAPAWALRWESPQSEGIFSPALKL